MRMSFSLFRTVFLVLISPVILFLSIIFVEDFVKLVIALSAGDLSPYTMNDLGFYIIFIPSMMVALGVRQIRRLL